MIDFSEILFGTIFMLLLMAAGINVAVVIFVVSITGILVFVSAGAALSVGTITWGVTNSFILTAIPLFILLGEILLRAGISEKMYQSLSHWVDWLPGRLLHTNVAASTLFSGIFGRDRGGHRTGCHSVDAGQGL
jgi:TRAP-type mannitol/chloroaromatic compound transport system permease large subunit